jgi:hypothetical protein
MEYALDANTARKADQRGGFIDETGKYIGKLTRAESITTDKGTKGIDFSFTSNDGRRTRFSIYTHKKDGSVISIGNSFVMALMTCLSVRSMSPKPTKVKKWDRNANTEVDATASCYQELMNKDIGLLLERETFIKEDGGTGSRMILAGVFQAGTELMASEILDKKVRPEQLGKVIDTLRDRVSKPRADSSSGGRAQPSDGGRGGLEEMDDDIPF